MAKHSVTGAKAQIAEEINPSLNIAKTIGNDNSQKLVVKKGDFINQPITVNFNFEPTIYKELKDSLMNQLKNEIVQIKSELEASLSNIPKEKIITYKDANMGAIKESIDNYYLNWNKNELKDYWKKIIINSFDKDKASDVHPSFIKIIQSLSTEEAKLLNKLIELFGLNFKIPVCSRLDKYEKFVDANGIEKTSKSFHTVHTYYTTYFIASPEKQAAMISNLIRLGIFEKPSDLYMVKKSNGKSEPIDEYQKIKDALIDLLKLDEKNCKYVIVKSQLSLTPFGKKLLSIVYDANTDFSKMYCFN